MNAPQNAGVAQATNRENARGRGRGGGRGGNRQTTTRAVAAKAAKSKIGPSRLLEADWVKENLLKEASFVVFAGSGVAGDQQWTYHRPIGETPLRMSQWVATPTRDLDYLLQRRESEALAAWKRQSELAKRRAVLSAQAGRKLDGQTEVWTFDGAPAIQPTIRTCMLAAKAASAPESEWLRYSDRAVQAAEQQFKEALRKQGIPEIWLAGNPRPKYETRGGPLGDRPQAAVPFLNGLSMAAAKDKVLRVAVGVDSAEELPLPEADEVPEEEEQAPTTHPAVLAVPAGEETTPANWADEVEKETTGLAGVTSKRGPKGPTPKP
jgi:hypothetical protein